MDWRLERVHEPRENIYAAVSGKKSPVITWLMWPLESVVYWCQANFTNDGVHASVWMRDLQRYSSHEEIKDWYVGSMEDAFRAEENNHFEYYAQSLVFLAGRLLKENKKSVENVVLPHFMRMFIGTVLGPQQNAQAAKKTIRSYLAIRGHSDKFMHFPFRQPSRWLYGINMQTLLMNLNDLIDDPLYQDKIFATPITVPRWGGWWNEWVQYIADSRGSSANKNEGLRISHVSTNSFSWQLASLETTGQLGCEILEALPETHSSEVFRVWFTGTTEQARLSVL